LEQRVLEVKQGYKAFTSKIPLFSGCYHT
jgi:hypothetical protein